MIKSGEEKDILVLAELAVQMWESSSIEELAEEMAELMAGEDARFFIKYEQEIPVGFAQCQLRHDYVEGTESSPVGYLEGIFVRAEYRHRGYAGELLRECEKWAREKGCREFASDCELVNEDSRRFHMAMGFSEANRIICFTKEL
ncbi:MAG: GNAT family N-acetyltransferase [Acetatifactor sp.]|nr:GNAT family N-acetyltransferase [Acetatifactor sp.]